jgi:hypothetical protein
MPYALKFIYENETKEDLSDAIYSSRYAGKIKWVGDNMTIDALVFKDLFRPFVDNIVNNVRVYCRWNV